MQGLGCENAVGVARQLYELHDEREEFEKSADYAQAALKSMQQILGRWCGRESSDRHTYLFKRHLSCTSRLL